MQRPDAVVGSGRLDSHTFCRVVVRPSAELIRHSAELAALCGEYVVSLPDSTPHHLVGGQAAAVVRKVLLLQDLDPDQWDLPIGATDLMGEALPMSGADTPTEYECSQVPASDVGGRKISESTVWKAPGFFGIEPADITMLSVAYHHAWAADPDQIATDHISLSEQLCLLTAETAAYLNEVVDFDIYDGVFYYDHVVMCPPSPLCEAVLSGGAPATVADLHSRLHTYLIEQGVDLVGEPSHTMAPG